MSRVCYLIFLIKKYVDTFSYEDLLDLYKILEKDDDTIFKWYSDLANTDEIDKNNVSNLLKSLKYNNGGEGGIRTHEW